MNKARRLRESLGIKTEPPKVGIVIPSPDQVSANFAMALASMTYSMGLPLCLINQKGSNIPANRNKGIEQCLKFGVDWCLMIDADMTFPHDACLRLLKHAMANNLDIVGATYARRTQPYNNLAIPLDYQPMQAEGLTEVEALPTGMMLIRLSCLEKMKRPYFRFVAVEEGEAPPAHLAKLVPDDGHARIIGEDYYFCAAARAAGLRVWMDVELSFELTHWGEQGIQLIRSEDGDVDSPRYHRVELPAAV